MKINRVNAIDKFSTFLFLSDTQKNIFIWKKDLKLKLNFEKLVPEKLTNSETIAYKFLNILRENQQVIVSNHLSSYLQEPCYWAAKQVYNQKQNLINLLTLEECFSSGNEATIKPDKILKNYQIHGASKITTYAQIRLKTIITDSIYRNRKWKLLTNWGLLKKIGKSQRKQVLKEVGGLKQEQLQEYLLVWQCYVDNAVPSHKSKSNSLSSPNSTQLQLMTNQYNLLAQQFLSPFFELSIDEFKTRLEFCAEKARLFVNPYTTSYEEDKKVFAEEIDENYYNYLANIEENQTKNIINKILIQAFKNLELNLQAIIYLYLGLDLTQQKVINIIQMTAPHFITQQYQLSRKINFIKKTLLDSLIEKLPVDKMVQTSKISTDKKLLLQLIQQWLEEYIESEILLLCHQSYQQIDRSQQESLKNDYYIQSLDKNLIVNQLIKILHQAIAKKLKIDLPENKTIEKPINLWLEKFFEQHFNKIDQLI
jgi:RNA polymerase sigma factor (sigma-70 family)